MSKIKLGSWFVATFVVAGLLFANVLPVLAADTGVKYPGTVSTISEGSFDDENWTSSGNIGANDGVETTITSATDFDNAENSFVLRATNFSSGIPAGATINGILVEVERDVDNGTARDSLVQLTKNGTARVGTNKADTTNNWSTSDTVASYGGSSDLWGTTWTAAEVNASTFGVHFAAQSYANDTDIDADFIRVTVYYTDTTAPVITQVTAVPSPTTDTTPDYVFSSTEAGTITYGGVCSAADTVASSGNNTQTFNALSLGTHSNCTIQVTDASGNASNVLNVNSFLIIGNSRTITNVTVNGGSSVTVAPGASITVAVTGALAAGGDWHSTAYEAGSSAPTAGTFDVCLNSSPTGTDDHDVAGVFTNTYSITAPGSAGTYNAYFSLNGSNSNCNNTSEDGPTYTLSAAIVVDATAPVATIDLQAASDTGSSSSDNLTNAASLVYDVTFTEAVATLAATDFAANPGTATSCVVGAPVGSGANYTVTVTGCSNSGTHILRLNAGGVEDAAGNDVVLTNGPTVTIDRLVPSTTILSAVDGDLDSVNIAGGTKTNSNEIYIAFSANGTGSAVAFSECKLDSGAYAPCTSPASYTGLSEGAHTVSIRSTDAAGNLESTATISWTTDYTAPVITVTGTNPVSVAYGIGYTGEGATATDNIDGSVAVVTTGTVSVTGTTGVGAYTTFYNATDAAGNTATQQTRTINVTPKALFIEADNDTKVYGETVTFAGTEFIATGLINGDTVTSVTLTSAGAVNTAPVALYDITPSDAVGTGLSNYAIAYDNGVLNVTPAPLSVTANPQTKVYGDSDPTFTYAVSGLVAGDTEGAVLSGVLARAAGETVLGSPYAITQGTLVSNGNYTLSFTGDSLTITVKAASVTPDASGKVYGAGEPVLTGTLAGFLPADSVTATYARTAGEDVGNYTISATLDPVGVLSNYSITYNTANFAITPASLVITASSDTMVYGAAVPTITPSYATFVNGDDASDLDTLPACSTTATSLSSVASYPSSCSGAADANYSISYVAGSVSVTPATLTIAAANKTKTYGDTVVFDETTPSTDFTVTGLLNSDTVDSITLASAGASAGAAVPGPYAITPSAAVGTGLGNYTIGYTDGALGINKADTTTTLTCTSPHVYTGIAIEPCTATVIGPNGLSESVSVVYTDNVNVGTAGASATYAGDSNYNGSSDSDSFSITPASSTTTVVCPANVTYTGLALTPCTATVTGAGSLNLDVSASIVYADNTNAGTASASYTYAGDSNHTGSSDSKNFTIDKATTTTLITCSTSQTYTGAAIEPCTAAVTGANLSTTATVTYTDNVNVGTANASATYAESANHLGSSDTETFAITAKALTVSAAGVNKVYDGTTAATVTLSDDRVSGDDITTAYTTAVFDTRNVGTGKEVYVSGISVSGPDAGNYSANTTALAFANVTKAPLTITAVTDTKAYNGTTASDEIPSVSGTQTGDTVTGLAQTYDTADVDTGKTMIVSAYSVNDGNDGLNYTITLETNDTGVITAIDANCVITGYSGTYDGAAHGATGTCTGVGNVVLSGLDLGASYTDVPGGTATWAFSNPNYLSEGGNVEIEIVALSLVGSFTADNKVYDGNTSAVVLTRSLAGVIVPDVVSLDGGTATFANANVGAGKTVTLSGATLGGADAGNYTLGSVNTTTADITEAPAVCAVNGFSGIYDGAAHGATGSCVGVLGETLSGLDLGASFTNVPGGTANWTFADVTGNYADQSGSASVVLTKATPVITVTPYSVTYDGLPHTAVGSALGVLSESLAGLDLSATTHTAAGTYTDDPWTFTDVTGNYTDASGVVTNTIGKANATIVVNGYTGVYDAAPHGATGSATGVNGEDLSSLLDLGASFTNVPGGTANWTFAGDTNYQSALGSVSIVITKGSSATVITNSLDLALTPSVVGETFTVEWAVTPTPAGTPTGTVFVTYNGNPGCSAPVADGGCELTFTSPQSMLLIATYGGDSNFVGSISATSPHSVVKANTTTTITNAAALSTPTTVGDSYTVAWEVAVVAPGSAPITGTVSVTGGSGCSAPVADGECTLTSTEAGLKTLLATYSGDSNLNGSASAGVEHLVEKGTLTITADDKTKVYGEADPSFTFTPSGFIIGVENTIDVAPVCTAADPHTNVGEYDITCAGGSDANYDFDFVVGTLTITEAPLTITANDQTKEWGTTFTFLGTEFTTSALIGGDSVTSATIASLGADSGAAVNTYPITISAAVGTGLSNYDITYVAGTMTVSDTVAPETTIDSAPTTTNDNTPAFTFSATESATFSCKIDAGAYAPCVSPFISSTLTDGPHTFSVFATDTNGNADLTPATASFTVDTVGPTVEIISGPTGTVATASGEFSYDDTTSDAVSLYCSLDGATAVLCNSGTFAFGPLDDGEHTFSVYGVDALGNEGTPDTQTWTIDAVGPVITAQDASAPTETTILVTWTTDHPATSRVVYGTASVTNASSTEAGPALYGYQSETAENPTLTTSHSVLVTGLTAGTTYYFRGVSHGSPESTSNEVSETTSQPQVTDICPNLPNAQETMPEGYELDNDGDCVLIVINSCPVPDTLGDNTAEVVNAAPGAEDDLQEILDTDTSYDLEVSFDQKQYQVWNVSPNSTVTVDATFVNRFAGHNSVFGYYVNGSTSSFVPVFKTANITGYEAVPMHTVGTFEIVVPEGATTMGFAIKTFNGTTPANTFATENALNTGSNDQVVVYNPAANAYVLGFEDLINTDEDFNDLVVEISLSCQLACELTDIETVIVSDTSTLSGGLPTVILSFIHTAWTATMDTAAKWIWNVEPLANAAAETTETFEKTFTIPGTPTSATLEIAADNSYEVSLNGNPVCADGTEFNYSSTDVCAVDTADFISGTNTLTFTVKNFAQSGGTQQSNPAGLRYKLTVHSQDCEAEPGPATLTITKDVVNAQGADVTDTHTFSVTVGDQTLSFGEGAPAVFTLAPGIYTVTEGVDAAYDLVSILNDEDPNTEGVQAVLGPNGNVGMTIINKQKPVIVDVCTNLPGNQETMPEGYELVEGECLLITAQCDIEAELLANGSFENPTVVHAALWNIVPSGTASWLAAWINGTSAPEVANLEIQKTGLNGWSASAGSQWAELDADYGGPDSSQSGEAGAVSISQDVVTTAGEDYTLTFDFSPRPGTAAAQNKLEVLADGNVIATVGPLAASGSATEWTNHTVTFTAADALTTIAFRDAGTPNDSLGTFLDNASLRCVPPPPPVDVCENIGGTQEVLPPGYEFTGEGQCELIDEEEPEEPTTATLVTTKIVCDSESDLPNWGAGNVVTQITASTASNFLASHPNCELQAGWQFQWAPSAATNPGNNNLVAAGAPWTSTGVTAANGTVSTEIPAGGLIWVREILKAGYIGFTGVNTTQSNSAEIYCNSDVLHYDNFDWVNPVVAGETYYCVAFNAPVDSEEPVCPEGTTLVEDQCVVNPQTKGKIIVTKQTVGGEGEFGFTSSYDGNFVLAGGTSHDSDLINPGNYTVSENPDSEWELTSATCVSSNEDEETPGNMILSAGETITCTFVNTFLGGEEEITTFSAPTGGGGGNPNFATFGFGGGNGGGGTVAGASISDVDIDDAVCSTPLLSSYMRRGKANDVDEVKKLQEFLNNEMGGSLPISGFFGPLTEALVKAFQIKYADQVLAPWGITDPTGYVYKTTQRMINLIYCDQLDIPMPDLSNEI